jgi:hypothetical protein
VRIGFQSGEGWIPVPLPPPITSTKPPSSLKNLTRVRLLPQLSPQQNTRFQANVSGRKRCGSGVGRGGHAVSRSSPPSSRLRRSGQVREATQKATAGERIVTHGAPLLPWGQEHVGNCAEREPDRLVAVARSLLVVCDAARQSRRSRQSGRTVSTKSSMASIRDRPPLGGPGLMLARISHQLV